MMDLLIYSLIACLGALLTSFYHLISMRIPLKKSISGRSICDHCQKTLRWLDILPFVGFLINKGKCHHCKQKIDYKYALFEVLGSLLFVFGYYVYGFSVIYIIYLVLISVLLIESISDVYYHHVIDRIWIIGFIILIPLNIIENQFFTHVLSSVMMFTLLYGLALLATKLYGENALGGGDVKLYILIGFTMPFTLGFLSLFLAALIGLIYAIIFKKTKQVIPWVPFIATASWISFLFGQQIIDSYLNLFLGV